MDDVRDYGSPRLLADLLASPAVPWGDVSIVLHDLPTSTLDKQRKEGNGPPTFLIGRRLYVRTVDLLAWIDQLAEEARKAEKEERVNAAPRAAPIRTRKKPMQDAAA